MKDSDLIQRVLAGYDDLENATISPLGNGLINQTFLVAAKQRQLVLQRLSPIFSPAINENIKAVTLALATAGLTTPRLVPTRDGRLWVDPGDQEGVWRMQTFVPGMSFDKVQSTAQAYAAGSLVARFHRALDGLDYTFVGLRTGVHDTAKHLARLREALALHPSHRLIVQVRPVAEVILTCASNLPELPDLPPRICHGDLKLNNILFQGTHPPDSDKALCLIDLDTVGPMPLAYELGDAWRSWLIAGAKCSGDHRSGRPARVVRRLCPGRRPRPDPPGTPSAASRRGMDHLELASRFAADALYESYFGWDKQRYPTRGEHNLVRSRGQLALHEAFVATRAERAAIVGL